MTKVKFFILFVLTFAIQSCSTDEPTQTLEGTWRLKNATAPEGASIEYNDGEVTWKFDVDTYKLYVQNNIQTLGPENIFSGLPTGTYNFSVVEGEGKKTLYVEGIQEGIFAYTTENLVINSDEDAEGVIKVFRR